MQRDDEVTLWLAAATLEADGQSIATFELDELKANVEAGKPLDDALREMRHFDQKAGDFGAEIIGPLLVPIVVEAAKQLWSGYIKQLAEQGSKQLAELTIDAAKSLLKRVWSREADVSQRYAELIRSEATRQKLPPEQVERLVQAVASPAFAKGFAAQ